ncbi:hypothetical protein JTE90_029655 [Oedothorax gibbosus]|uniref:Uncharacterized protein n=1 Tax=Oedothorax gibbosus TaxID=931172 RepID=A0AAV6VH78_9ARAC|nr:hypothetical protein JTE90_029655 [Oedothorax gibbosus]
MRSEEVRWNLDGIKTGPADNNSSLPMRSEEVQAEGDRLPSPVDTRKDVLKDTCRRSRKQKDTSEHLED